MSAVDDPAPLRPSPGALAPEFNIGNVTDINIVISVARLYTFFALGAILPVIVGALPTSHTLSPLPLAGKNCPNAAVTSCCASFVRAQWVPVKAYLSERPFTSGRLPGGLGVGGGDGNLKWVSQTLCRFPGWFTRRFCSWLDHPVSQHIVWFATECTQQFAGVISLPDVDKW